MWKDPAEAPVLDLDTQTTTYELKRLLILKKGMLLHRLFDGKWKRPLSELPENCFTPIIGLKDSWQPS